MAAFFSAANVTFQLYKLGDDQSVTQWTAINTGGLGLTPFDLTAFDGNVWFDGDTGQGRQLYKLGFDGSVTKWTALGGGLFPDPFNPPTDVSEDLTVFNDALWFAGGAPNLGLQLYK